MTYKPKGFECVCDPCGQKYGKRTSGTSTWHAGTCVICNNRNYVTEARDYGFGTDAECDEVKNLLKLFGIK